MSLLIAGFTDFWEDISTAMEIENTVARVVDELDSGEL